MILMHVLKHIEQFNLLYKYAVFGKYFFGGKLVFVIERREGVGGA